MNRIRRRAVTLKDLLVVMATGAVGLSVAVPALSRAREAERSAACQATLRQLGYGISMYAADQAGSLPGPTTMHLPYNAGPSYLSGGTQGSAYYKVQLTSYLAPYLVAPGDARAADLIPLCPTADTIPVKGSAGQAWYYAPRSYYILNTLASDNVTSIYPYRGTKPRYYFGYIQYVGERVESLPAARLPKKLADIPNPSKEWGIADLWHWQAKGSGGRGATRPVGTWTILLSDAATSGNITNTGGLKVPSYPFHMTGRTFQSDPNMAVGVDSTTSSPRLTTGRTNALYFDGHAEGVQEWKGTVNPCPLGDLTCRSSCLSPSDPTCN